MRDSLRSIHAVLLLTIAGCATGNTPSGGPPLALADAPTAARATMSAPATAAAPTEPAYAIPDIAFARYVLGNGLTLIVHEDHKAPIVTVNVWYHVGSKNEPEGRTGFAHVFEHLMFNGSENNDDDYFQVMERIGATDLNGTTNNDRTNYFQNVPTSAADVALWMESDRMGHLLGAIDQAKLDEQRGVVQNEKRQGENQPYGRVFDLIMENSYPTGHPYAHSVIGSMADLNAASLDDVKEWFRTYYGPNNAVLVVAGDITPEAAKAKVEQYFGAIPPSPPIEKYEAWVAPMATDHRQILQDRVPQARIYRVWNVPEWGAEDAAYLDLATDILSSGKTSRLYKRLVYDDQIATDAGAMLWTREIGSSFILMASARPGVDLAEVERALDEEMAHFLDEGPTPAELERVKTTYYAGFIRGIERIGGFGGKSDVLAQGEVYAGSPDHYKRYGEWLLAATPDRIRKAALEWLTQGAYTLEVHPYPKLGATGDDADRSHVPATGAPPAPSFPAIQRATLSNGLKVVLAERHTLPVVDLSLMVDAGYAADQHGDPGTANLTLDMMDEGTTSRSALEISEELNGLGARLSTGSDLDASYVDLSALTAQLDPALDIFADVVLNPSFPESDFTRLKKQQLARIQQEKNSPFAMALRVFPTLLYGQGHPYAIPFTGSGDEAAVQALTVEALAAFHHTWFRPNNATLVAVGDITMDELRPRLEARFGDWAPGNVPPKEIGAAPQATGAVYLMDKPGAQQSVIVVGEAFPSPATPDAFAIRTLNRIMGGSFTSRINMNLREDKHWSYGARSLVYSARGPRPFLAYAPVQTDRTRESMQELMAELTGVRGDRPATAEELDKARDGETLTLSGRWETGRAIRSSLIEQVSLGLPDDYWQNYSDHVRGVSLEQVNRAARDHIHPDRLVWVVVGDREKVEAGIRELGYGPLRLITPDGQVSTTTAGGS